IRAYFANNQVLKGKRVLITAGPTYEALEPVRLIGNHSSGKMGIAIAREIAERGGEVTLVLGPSSVKFNEHGIEVIRVTSSQEMYNACLERFAATELAILSAAVADYTPVAKAEQKMKKECEGLQVELKRTPDILKSLGERTHN